MKPEANGEIFNIGSHHEITILDLARTIKRLSQTPGDLKLKFIPYESLSGRKYEDVRRRVPDTSLCERILGVKPWIGLEEGLSRTIEWQRRLKQNEPAHEDRHTRRRHDRIGIGLSPFC
jgi:UDP-glucose 4-epimerase